MFVIFSCLEYLNLIHALFLIIYALGDVCEVVNNKDVGVDKLQTHSSAASRRCVRAKAFDQSNYDREPKTGRLGCSGSRYPSRTRIEQSHPVSAL